MYGRYANVLERLEGLGGDVPFQGKSALWQICFRSEEPGKVCLEISSDLGTRPRIQQNSAEHKTLREKYFGLHGCCYFLINVSD